ncbi:MAG: hypothetical protein U9N02_08390 [Campylobacterota bacterium]|nr:hypothetical protein [Campylobacterota bacterium]
MEEEIIDMREATPKLNSQKCKIIALAIEIFLTYSIYIASLISWYIYDYFIAFFVLILSFIVMGIIRSKIRNAAIPSKQREYQYTDKEISNFYTAYEIC